MKVIGLTGGIGSGKSTVSRLFAEHGAKIIDTDELAREVVKPGQAGNLALQQAIGPEYFGKDGQLDRQRLREAIFTTPSLKKTVEEILHPAIHNALGERLAQLREAGEPYVVVEIPLLLESGFDDLVDEILVVDCPEELQLSRAMQRDGATEQDIRNIMANQVGRETRQKAADHLVNNNLPLEKTRQQVDKLHRLFSQNADSL